jgi:hypothetical protein
MALPSAATHASNVDTPAASESHDAVVELLIEAGVLPERPRALIAAPDDPQSARLACLRRLMAYVRDADMTAYVGRSRELAFLGNTLLAGCSVQSRPFTPQEASDAAAATCNLGLECWPARWHGAASPGASSHSPEASAPKLPGTLPPDSFLIEHDLVTAFEVGWSVLHHDVSLFVVEQLIALLAQVDAVERDIRGGLVALRRALVTGRDAGRPWRARDAAEILAMLDTTAWIAVLGLLDECPVLPAALTAVVEGRTTAVSPTAFAFISTAAQIADVRRFMRKLRDVLSG